MPLVIGMPRNDWKDRKPITNKLQPRQLPEDLVDETKENLDSDSATILCNFQHLIQESEETSEKAWEVERKISQIVE